MFVCEHFHFSFLLLPFKMCVVKFLQVKVVKSDKAMGTVCDLREFLDNSIMLLLVAVHVCWLHSVRTKTN